MVLHIQMHFIEQKGKVVKKSLSQGMLVGFSGSPNVACRLVVLDFEFLQSRDIYKPYIIES